MKRSLFIVIALVAMNFGSCNAQPAVKANVATSTGNNVEVYYFHFTTRCNTCRTVESEAHKNVEILYADLVKSGKISFTAVNLDEANGKELGDKIGVSGQTLLIVKGDQKINITNEGFLYAVSKPDKLREIMKEKIDPLVQ
jgi:hypothetical protein